MEIKNAKIESTTLGYEDHGIFTFMLHLDYGHSGQGFGGYALDEPKPPLDRLRVDRQGTAMGMQVIIEILNTVGVQNWEDLPGQYIRVEADHTKVIRIGHLLEDKWFDMADLQ